MRAVDPRRTRKALQRVRRLEASAAQGTLSEWEKTFLGEVGARLEEYGSAFADYAKGAPDEALSRLQGAKLREISSKAHKDGKTPDGASSDAPNDINGEAYPGVSTRKPQGLSRRTPLRTKRKPRITPAAEDEEN